MFLPLRVDRPLRRATRVTYALIVINVAVFLAQQAGAGAVDDGASWWSSFALARGLQPWPYLTYMFLHADFWHIAGNMLILAVFGPAIEDRLGRWGFVAFYTVGGVLAGVAHVLSTPAAVIGASGAVSAVTGAFLVLFPRSRVITLMFMGFAPVPAWFFIGLAVVRDLFSIGFGAGGQIANEAHLGGYAFGAGLSFLLLALRAIPREPYDLFSVTKQAGRRRAIRAAAAEATDRMARVRRDPARETIEPISDEVADMRAAVTRALAEHRAADAVEAYRGLAERYGRSKPSAATLNRRAQMEIGAELYRRGEHDLADFAFSRYVDAYPSEPDTPEVRVLLARIKARHRGEPEQAAAMLEHAITELAEGSVRDAALAELESLRAAGAGGGAGGRR